MLDINITNQLTWIFLFIALVVLLSFLRDKKIKIKKVIFFGDSITEFGVERGGYIAVMKEILIQQNIKNYELIGAGISGDTVQDLIARIKDVIVQSPDIVVLWIGANDVWQQTDFTIEPDTLNFEKHYRVVIETLQKNKVQLMLVTPAVIGEKKDNENPLDKNMNAYCEAIRTIADEFKLPLCDMRSFFQLYEMKHNRMNANKGILTIDGVHLNDAGNRFAANEILKVLKEV